MSEHAGDSSAIEVAGTLRWNEFEGGFWSLEPLERHETLGSSIVLVDFTPPPGASDGSPMVVKVVPRPDLIGFTMAGIHAEVLDARVDE